MARADEIRKHTEELGLPVRMFFYTPDQIAGMLEVEVQYVMDKMLYYEGREPGIPPKSKMKAVNVAPDGEVPIWRVSERQFTIYLRRKGIRFYTRGYGS